LPARSSSGSQHSVPPARSSAPHRLPERVSSAVGLTGRSPSPTRSPALVAGHHNSPHRRLPERVLPAADLNGRSPAPAAGHRVLSAADLNSRSPAPVAGHLTIIHSSGALRQPGEHLLKAVAHHIAGSFSPASAAVDRQPLAEKLQQYYVDIYQHQQYLSRE
jgi:hypothetical protein